MAGLAKALLTEVTRRWALVAAAATLVVLMLPASGPERVSAQGGTDPSVMGSWSAPFDIGVKGIHSVVLPNGRVLLFSYPFHSVGSDAYVWDPATGGTTNVSLTWNRDIFCAGHSLLPDGRLLHHRRARAPRRLRAGRQEHRHLRPRDAHLHLRAAAQRGALVSDQRDAPRTGGC